MNLLNVHPKIKKRAKYKSYKLDKDIHNFPDLIQRNFHAAVPNLKWTTDITEFKIPCSTTKLYLSPVLDMCTREIVSYKMSTSPNVELVYESIKEAIDKNINSLQEGIKFHSDRGFQNNSTAVIELLKKHGIEQSMSRKGNCNDNGIMESFFGIMKNEMFYGHEHEFKNLDHLAVKIDEYINFYNNFRIKIGLNGMSPVQFKKLLTVNSL